MSDKASQIDSEYQPSQWMMDQELKDDNWENLQLDHLVDGETVNDIKVKGNNNKP